MNMHQYIAEIPGAVNRILQQNQAVNEKTIPIEPDTVEIVYIGSGTSYHAALVARYFIEKVLRIRVTCYVPHTFLNYETLRDNAVYVAISQSGTSRLTYQALERVKQDGRKTVSLTEGMDNPIATLADVNYDFGCGFEDIPYKTKGYVSSVLMLMITALEWAKELGRITNEEYQAYWLNLNEVAEKLPLHLTESEAWYQNNKAKLMDKGQFVFIGAAENYATAMEAGLKVVETVKCITNSYELEEYMHGPQNAFSEESAVFILETEDSSKEKAKTLASYFKTKSSAVFLVGKDGDLKLDLSGNRYFAPLELILPFQVLSAQLSDDRGVDLSKKRFPDFDEFVGKKL